MEGEKGKWSMRRESEEGEVPGDWKKAIIVPLYKGKGSRSE